MDPNMGVEQIQKSFEVKPAGAWSRFWASMIDGLILAIPIFLILSLIYLILPSLLVSFVNKNHPYGIIYIISPILGLLYSAYLTVNKGATWGKDAYGLKVVKYKTTENISYGKSFLRDLIKSGFYFIPAFSGLIALINGFTVVFSSEKRGIHDKIAGTQVIKFKNPWSMKKQLLILLPLLIFAFISVALYSRAMNTLVSKNTLNQVSLLDPSINPAVKRVYEKGNAQRLKDVNSILDAIYKYSADHNGEIPDGISTERKSIASPYNSSDKSSVDLCKILVPKYMPAIPRDIRVTPFGEKSPLSDCGKGYTTAYEVFRDSATNQVTVSAHYTNLGAKIEATR
jgi:uncharacterized RDD family membrane protein YckC